MNIVPCLQLIDVDQIFFHEPVEPARLKRILPEIQKEGILHHPIIVTSLSKNKYLVLDGAHRAHSLRQLGYPKIPVQLVDTTNISIEPWEHLLQTGPWLDSLQQELPLKWMDRLLSNSPVATVVYPDQTKFWIYPKYESMKHRTRTHLKEWCQLVEFYTQDQSVIRLPQGKYIFPKENQILFRFPTLTLEEIKEIVYAGELLPAGVTRFIVQGRLLNLNIPLSLLTCTLNKSEWEKFCEKKANKLRLYSESVYLCEV
ncbi:ParB N-terminal domain-containing protein [Bacillus cereus]|uniref:ParB N-terminal domain-containing protein n=1 Tax=Bacillus cereus TaxID=1396 RepID=UPI002480642C|nr:ParB N-terminal domain-containing protein [Bacillus cereus]MDH8001279.1 ParB N-terminal domain-containing protein [Bacillus cereus]